MQMLEMMMKDRYEGKADKVKRCNNETITQLNKALKTRTNVGRFRVEKASRATSFPNSVIIVDSNVFLSRRSLEDDR